MNEAFYIANLFFVYNETSFHAKDDEYHVISASWFKRWKKYTNFDFLMQHAEIFRRINSYEFTNTQPQEMDEHKKAAFSAAFLQENSRFYPGIVTNKELLVARELHHENYSNPESFMNYNILEHFETGQDFIVVPKTIFRFFQVVYGGFDIKRYSLAFGEGSAVEVKLLSVWF